ncbi:MAG TPA: hypothetical protein VEV17_26705 [Bryobacteraceae bacterium]|nr:hypothetical protein [Bryobacteraceae bacterium]
MKLHRLTSVLGLLAAVATAHVALAQSLQTSGPTNFPMVGIVRGQTLVLNLVAFPPDPCMAQLGIQDSNGNLVASTQVLTLLPGQSAVLSVNANTLTNAFAQRVELLPTVQGPDGAFTASSCVATAEVVDNLVRETTVQAPGAVAWPPSPIFGMLGVTLLDTVRLNVVAFPPTPCIGTISFVDANGNQIGNSKAVQLAAGQGATFLDLPGNAVVSALGQRVEVRPVVALTGGSACIASAEVYGNVTGATHVYYPPNPCGPTSTSCIVF